MAIGEICTQDGAILDVRRRGQTVAMVVRKLGVLSVPVAAAPCALGPSAAAVPPSPKDARGRLSARPRYGDGAVLVVRGPLGRGLVQLLWLNPKGGDRAREPVSITGTQQCPAHPHPGRPQTHRIPAAWKPRLACSFGSGLAGYRPRRG